MHCLRFPTISLLSLLLLASDALVNAALFNFQVRTPAIADPPTPISSRRQLRPRAGSSNSSSNGTIPVLNTLNSEYISNITLGGRTIPVLLDTGRHATTFLLDLLLLLLFVLMSCSLALTYGLPGMFPAPKTWGRRSRCPTLLALPQVCAI